MFVASKLPLNNITSATSHDDFSLGMPSRLMTMSLGGP
jgi:hypothetical protein